MKDNIYGIEVEPEYVSFAGWVKDDIEVYMNHEGELRTPSMVLFNKDNAIDVGIVVMDYMEMELENENVVAPTENRNKITYFPYKYENQLFDEEDIVAFILKKVINDIKKREDIDFNKVVISYPAYYSAKQVERIRTSGVLAELNVCSLIPDSVALLHSNKDLVNVLEGKEAIVSILQENHISTSIVKIQNGNVELCCAAGTSSIGGWQWNGYMLNYIVNLLCNEYGVPKSEIYDDQDMMFLIRHKAEVTLKSLVESDKSRLCVRLFTGKNINIEIERAEFERNTKPLTNQVINFIQDMVGQAYCNRKIKHNRINSIIFAGDYEHWIREEIKTKIDADICVCALKSDIVKGTVMYGEILKQRIEKLDMAMNGKFDYINL